MVTGGGRQAEGRRRVTQKPGSASEASRGPGTPAGLRRRGYRPSGSRLSGAVWMAAAGACDPAAYARRAAVRSRCRTGGRRARRRLAPTGRGPCPGGLDSRARVAPSTSSSTTAGAAAPACAWRVTTPSSVTSLACESSSALVHPGSAGSAHRTSTLRSAQPVDAVDAQGRRRPACPASLSGSITICTSASVTFSMRRSAWPRMRDVPCARAVTSRTTTSRWLRASTRGVRFLRTK